MPRLQPGCKRERGDVLLEHRREADEGGGLPVDGLQHVVEERLHRGPQAP